MVLRMWIILLKNAMLHLLSIEINLKRFLKRNKRITINKKAYILNQVAHTFVVDEVSN